MNGDWCADATSPRAQPAEEQARKEDGEARRVEVDGKMNEREEHALEEPRADVQVDSEPTSCRGPEVIAQACLNEAAKERFLRQAHHQHLSGGERREVRRKSKDERVVWSMPPAEAKGERGENDRGDSEGNGDLPERAGKAVANDPDEVKDSEGACVLLGALEKSADGDSEVMDAVLDALGSPKRAKEKERADGEVDVLVEGGDAAEASDREGEGCDEAEDPENLLQWRATHGGGIARLA